MRGDKEENVQNTPKDVLTVNKININLMLTEAVRQGWEINSSDIARAFLQTNSIERNVYVKPPREARVPGEKVLMLKPPAYGFIDTAHSFFLDYTENLIALGCETCEMDNASFLYFQDKSKPTHSSRKLKGIVATHIDAALTVGNQNFRNNVLEEMKKKFT